MKIVQFTYLFLSMFYFCSSQTSLVPVTFIIEDSDTHAEIVGALLTVRQTAQTQPTLANGKVKFENVPVGEIEYYISKEGYQFETGRRNVSSDIKTNNFRIPISKLDDKKILVTGEVLDAQGRDLKDATIEVKIADQVRTVMSDAAGNYSLEIAPSIKFPTSIIRIEVKKGDCKKLEVIDIPITNVVYKDFKLDCSFESELDPEKSTTKTKPSSLIIEDDNVTYEFRECKRQGENVKIVLLITSKEDKQLLIVDNNYGDNSTIAFDNFGNSYKVDQINIGNQIVNPNYGQKIIQGVSTEMVLLFKGLNINASTISLQLSFNRGSHHFMFRNLPIK